MEYILISIIFISFTLMCVDFISSYIVSKKKVSTKEVDNHIIIDLNYSADLLELINLTIDVEICAYFKFDIMSGNNIDYTFFDNAVKKIATDVKNSIKPDIVNSDIIYKPEYIDRFIVNQTVLKTDAFIKTHNGPI